MAERRRPSRWLRFLKRFCLVVGLLALLILLLYFLIPPVAVRIAEAKLGEMLNSRVAIGAIRLSSFSGACVESLRVWPAGEGEGGPSILDIKRIDVSWRFARRFKPVLQSVRVEGIRAELDSILQTVSRAQPSSALSPPAGIHESLALAPGELAFKDVMLGYGGLWVSVRETRVALVRSEVATGVELAVRGLSGSGSEALGLPEGVNILEGGRVQLVAAVGASDCEIRELVLELPEALSMRGSGRFQDVTTSPSGAFRLNTLRVRPDFVAAALADIAPELRLSGPLVLDGLAVELCRPGPDGMREATVFVSFWETDLLLPNRSFSLEQAGLRTAITIGLGHGKEVPFSAKGGIRIGRLIAGGFPVPDVAFRYSLEGRVNALAGELSIGALELSSPSYSLDGSAELNLSPGAMPLWSCEVDLKSVNIGDLVQSLGVQIPNLELEVSRGQGHFRVGAEGQSLLAATGSFSLRDFGLAAAGEPSPLLSAEAEGTVRADIARGEADVQLQRFSFGDVVSGRAGARLSSAGMDFRCALDPLRPATLQSIIPSAAPFLREPLAECPVSLSASAEIRLPEVAFTSQVTVAPSDGWPSGWEEGPVAEVAVSGRLVRSGDDTQPGAAGEIAGMVLGSELKAAGEAEAFGGSLAETNFEGSLTLENVDLGRVLPELSALLHCELPPIGGKLSLSTGFGHGAGSPIRVEASLKAGEVSTRELRQVFYMGIPASARAKVTFLPDLKVFEVESLQAEAADAASISASGRVMDPFGEMGLELQGRVTTALGGLPLRAKFGQAEGELAADFWMRPLVEDAALLEVGGKLLLTASEVAVPGGVATIKDAVASVEFDGAIPGPRDIAGAAPEKYKVSGKGSVEIGGLTLGGLRAAGLGAGLDFYGTQATIFDGKGSIYGGSVAFDGTVSLPRLGGRFWWRLRDLDAQAAIEALGRKEMQASAKLSGFGTVAIEGGQLADMNLDMGVGSKGLLMDRKLARQVLDYSLAQALRSLPLGSVDDYLGPSDPHLFSRAKIKGELQGNVMHLRPVIEDPKIRLTYDISLDMPIVWEYLRSQQEMMAAFR